jgi:hypothetical protein
MVKLAALGLALLAVVGVAAALLLGEGDEAALSQAQAQKFAAQISCARYDDLERTKPPRADQMRCDRQDDRWSCSGAGKHAAAVVTFPDVEHPEVSVIC